MKLLAGALLWLSLLAPASAQFYGQAAPALPSMPLDSLPAPAICYGTKRLLTSYVNNAAVDLSLNGITKTIGFVNNSFDYGTANSFCAGSQVCYVVKWYDQCGSGQDASRAAGVNAPLWYAPNNINGLSAVVFDFDFNSDHTGLDIPATFAWTPGNPTSVFMIGQPLVSMNPAAVFEDPNGTGNNAISSSTSPGTCNGTACGPPSIGIYTKFYSTTAMEVQPSIFSFNWQAGVATAGSNDQSSSGTATALTAQTGATIGANASAGNSASMDAVGLLVYTSSLTPAQMTTIRTTLASGFGIQQSYSNVVVTDGDSISAGRGSALNNSPTKFALKKLNHPIRAYNIAIPGETVCTMASQFNANIAPIYKVSYANFVVHLFGYTNDIRQSGTASGIYGCLQNYVNLVHALGPNAKVIITTGYLPCDIFQSGTELPIFQTVTNNILANWNVAQSSGGLGADGLDNWFGIPIVGPGNYSSSVFCGFPNNYTPDGVHPTDYTDSILGQYQAASINALLP
jgi:hypothetical protein